jgi:hypothetical protein
MAGGVRRAVQRLEMDNTIVVERFNDGSLFIISTGRCPVCVGERVELTRDQVEGLRLLLDRPLPKEA